MVTNMKWLSGLVVLLGVVFLCANPINNVSATKAFIGESAATGSDKLPRPSNELIAENKKDSDSVDVALVKEKEMNLDTLNKDGKLKEENKISVNSERSFKTAGNVDKDIAKNAVIISGGLVTTVVGAGTVLAVKSLNSRQKDKKTEDEQHYEGDDYPNSSIGPKNSDIEEKGNELPRAAKISILVYCLLAAIIAIETSILQIYEIYKFGETYGCGEWTCEIFRAFGEGIVNGLFLGIPGFVVSRDYCGGFIARACLGFN